MCLKAAHISGSIKRALQVKGIWGMCYTMAYSSAHYGALLDIGWYFGSPAAVVFAQTRVFIGRVKASKALLIDSCFFSPFLTYFISKRGGRGILESSE